MDIVERLRSDYGIGYETRLEAANEIERLREVVMLLIKFDEHNEDIYRGAVMWEVLIEAAHAAMKEKE